MKASNELADLIEAQALKMAKAMVAEAMKLVESRLSGAVASAAHGVPLDALLERTAPAEAPRKKGRRASPRHYSPEFRRKAVAAVLQAREAGAPVKAVLNVLGNLSPGTVYRWIHEAEQA